MNKTEIAGLTGIVSLAIIAYVTTPKHQEIGYQPEKHGQQTINQQIIDNNENGRLDLGDKIMFAYDTNNDGNGDMMTLHWIRGMTEDLQIDYWEMPHLMLIDHDYDGNPDMEYRGFNEYGIPSISKKVLQPVKEQYAREE